MTRDSRRSTRPGTRIVRIAWVLASALFLFTSENIWLDPWLGHKFHHRMPSLVPASLSGVWFLVFLVGTIALILLVVCEILLIRDRGVHLRTRLGIGFAVLIVLFLSADWFRVTNGQPSIFQLSASGKKHTVTLRWNASTSRVAGYNVYRRSASEGNYQRVNPSLVQALTYIDEKVESGLTYYYVARAVDAEGRESINSNESSAAVP